MDKTEEKPLFTARHEIYLNGDWEREEEYHCYAPKTWYREWEEWTDEDKAILDKHVSNGLNCEGGLFPGEWCNMCELSRPQGYGESND